MSVRKPRPLISLQLQRVLVARARLHRVFTTAHQEALEDAVRILRIVEASYPFHSLMDSAEAREGSRIELEGDRITRRCHCGFCDQEEVRRAVA